MKKIVLRIGGMTCSACSSGLEKYLSRQEGVSSASVNLVLSLATIEYENLSKKDLERFVKEAGFQSLGEFKGVEDLESKKEIHRIRNFDSHHDVFRNGRDVRSSYHSFSKYGLSGAFIFRSSFDYDRLFDFWIRYFKKWIYEFDSSYA